MLKIDRQNKFLSRLPTHRLKDLGLLERQDLQAMIRQSPEEFFKEIGETLLLIGEEVVPSDAVGNRIDLLGIDKNGASVIIEIKRDSHKLHLLQGLTYAAMISRWDRTQFDYEFSKLNDSELIEANEKIEEFINGFIPINQSQRIILLAEDFDYEVLVTAEWLTEKYGINVRCYRLSLAKDQEAEYVSIVCVYPPSGITDHSIQRGRSQEVRASSWDNWDVAIEAIRNESLRNFMKCHRNDGNSNLGKRSVRFRIGNQNRFSVSAKPEHAYVWQNSRFPDDVKFWTKNLGDTADVRPVESQRALSFKLKTEEQFSVFISCLNGDLKNMKFSIGPKDLDEDEHPY